VYSVSQALQTYRPGSLIGLGLWNTLQPQLHRKGLPATFKITFGWESSFSSGIAVSMPRPAQRFD